MAVSVNAATFLGIVNENDFYSAHYLAEVFKGDIKEILDNWKNREDSEEDFQAPFNRLKSIAREYFAMRERSQRERNQQRAIAMQREFFKVFCHAMDLPWCPQNLSVEVEGTKEDLELPVLSVVPQNHGQLASKLWVLGALDLEKEGTDPLLLELRKEQFIGEGPHADKLKNKSWYDLINDVVFKQSEPPRWVMLLSDRQCILIDRYKWLQNRLLRFDLDEILGRKDTTTLQATAALLHSESLLPEQGSSLLDNLDENSHKHAFGVSEDLKYALRESIELLGNEAAAQLIQRKEISFTGKSALDADALSRECLRYMYRLLFLFYIEARPELKYVPVDSPAYRKGYSLESLRDLELVKLTSEESRNGHYIHYSINKLFNLIHEGYSGEGEASGQADLGDAWEERGVHNSFTLQKLDSHLFDPARTPYLNKVKFSNKTLQTVINRMSLTRETSGRGKNRRGRVSYAQLGINQLGAVYEALLSYRGFFASKDLYEVKNAKDKYDELETGYFVGADEIGNYKDEEKVYTKDEAGHKALKVHPKGKFIYRLAGRDRQKSASYYTPEVLTKCLVKYTLKERLEGLTADQILELTVCEPAMGSAAFLNEAVNQLAEAYLTLKQQELNQRIPHEEYRDALQQVKMHIADHNVYGVDLNPIAVELAEVSLWLNALSESSVVPWFGYQLFNGNSLIGARRLVYRPDQVLTNRKEDKWFKHEPKRLDPQNPSRNAEDIYHFLLPDEGMVGVSDKEAKKLKPDAFKKIADWKKQFIKPLTKDELALLQQMSGAIDALWSQHTNMLRQDRGKTEDQFAIWGQSSNEFHTSTQQKDQIRSEGIFNINAKIASPYRRLKLAMDYWCALWFWPIDKVDLLPERSQWFFELNLILQGQVFSFQPVQGGLELDSVSDDAFAKPIDDMFAEDEQQINLTEQEEKAQLVKTAQGEINLEKLFKQFPRLDLVNKLSGRYKFFHWEIAFADVFSDKGGFDVMLGNPPWLKVEWQEGGILGDYNPQFVLRKFSASKLRDKRASAFNDNVALEVDWFDELVQSEGMQRYLNANQTFPELGGQKANLYKCFLPQAWRWGNLNSYSGFLHPEGVYDDPSGGGFRKEIYLRLCCHFQFQNELNLFAEVDHKEIFSINIYQTRKKDRVGFFHVSNLFSPSTLSSCFEKSISSSAIQGIKNDKGEWNVLGSQNRLNCIDMSSLEVFSKLMNSDEIFPIESKLPAVHSKEMLSILSKLANQKSKLSNLKREYFSTSMWNEVNSVVDGTLKEMTSFVTKSSEVIVSGPHLFIANPLYKTPREVCEQNSHYDVIDYDYIPDNYIPRTNFSVDCGNVEYRRRTPKVPWVTDGNGEKVTDYFRLFCRGMLKPGNERTLITAIMPPGLAHTNAIRSYVFHPSRIKEFLVFSASTFSTIFDFQVRSSAKTNLHQMLDDFPLVQCFSDELSVRVLLLTCVTQSYKPLWEHAWKDHFTKDQWATACSSLDGALFNNLSNTYKEGGGLKDDLSRRQALLEIDVLVAMALELSLEEVISLYCIQFPVMRQYERETYYDQNGRIVFTPSKGLIGVGLDRKAKKGVEYIVEYPDESTETKPLGWEDICPEPAKEGEEYGKPRITDGTKIHRKVIDDTLPGGPREKIITYVAPFYLPNREEDYRVAWEVFEKRFNQSKEQ